MCAAKDCSSLCGLAINCCTAPVNSCLSAVCVYLFPLQLRQFANAKMKRSKALAALAAAGAPWDLSTSPYEERTSGMEWEDLLAHLAGLAEQVTRDGPVLGFELAWHDMILQACDAVLRCLPSFLYGSVCHAPLPDLCSVGFATVPGAS